MFYELGSFVFFRKFVNILFILGFLDKTGYLGYFHVEDLRIHLPGNEFALHSPDTGYDICVFDVI